MQAPSGPGTGKKATPGHSDWLTRDMYFTPSGWHQCEGDCGQLLPSTDSFFPDHSRCNLCFREGR